MGCGSMFPTLVILESADGFHAARFGCLTTGCMLFSGGWLLQAIWDIMLSGRGQERMLRLLAAEAVCSG